MNLQNSMKINSEFESNNIKSILLVDDVFDKPEFNSSMRGATLKQVAKVSNTTDIIDKFLNKNQRSQISTNLRKRLDKNNKYERLLLNLYNSLFEELQGGNESNVIRNIFGVDKIAAIKSIIPFINLVKQNNSKIQVEKIGTDLKKFSTKITSADIILMDYILSPTDDGGSKSIQVLTNVLKKFGKNGASVLLMSDKVASKKRLEEIKQSYFEEIDDLVMAVQFDFFNKKWIKIANKKIISDVKAVSVISEISNSLKFGKSLKIALGKWKTGVKLAKEDLYKKISHLDIKDFVYLWRYRLSEEGASFSSYLEWFLGESIRSIIDERVAWDDQNFKNLEDDKFLNSIIGAHSKPTDKLAELYNKVRINHFEGTKRSHLNLGDIFYSEVKNEVRMIITSGCDLIPRGKKNETNSEYFLTVGGNILGFDKSKAFVGELIVINETTRAIEWKLKDICSHKLDIKNINSLDKNFQYIGTLRPLFAKKVQTQVLSDLSRVGISTPPPIYVNAPVKTILRTSKKIAKPLNGIPEAYVTVLLAVGGIPAKKNHSILFHETFVDALLVKLHKLIKKGGIEKPYLNNIQNFINEDSEPSVKNLLLRKGLKLSEIGKFDIGVLKNENEKTNSWLNFIVDLSDEQLFEVQFNQPISNI